jgi:hypothetical protein
LIKLTYNYDYINKFSEWNNLEFDEVEWKILDIILDF